MDSDAVRASELGTYLYCRRAWWYAKTGAQGMNTDEMMAGSNWHRDQARQVRSAGCLRTLGLVALSGAFFMLVLYLAGLAIG